MKIVVGVVKLLAQNYPPGNYPQNYPPKLSPKLSPRNNTIPQDSSQLFAHNF